MIKGPKKTVSVVISQEFYDALKEQATATCRTVPAYIRQVLKGREPPVAWPVEGKSPKFDP